MEEIKAGKYVELAYELYVGEGEEQELMEKTSDDVLLKFVVKAGQMLESFENNLMGLKADEKFDFTIPAADAYGEHEPERVLELEKEMFCIDGVFDAEHIFEGNTVPLMDSYGNRHQGSVIEVQEEKVIMDLNHPLAGEDLHFIGEVKLVRDSTPEDLAPADGCSGCSGCGGDCNDGDCDCGGCN